MWLNYAAAPKYFDAALAGNEGLPLNVRERTGERTSETGHECDSKFNC